MAGILLVANNFPPVRGGSAVVYENLARNADGNVVVLAPRLNYTDGLPVIGWREHDRQAPYRIVRLPLLRTTLHAGQRRMGSRLWFLAQDLWIRVRLVITVLLLVRRENLTAVCVGELLANGWLLGVLRAVPGLRLLVPGLRLLVYVHGEEITTEDRYDRGARRRRQALLADRLIVVSRFTRDAVLALLGPSAGRKMSLIENGVDTGRFHPIAPRQNLLDLYGLRGSFVFVSVCRLLEKKGIDNAIRAFAELAAQDPDCRFLVVGAGPFQDRLRAIAAATGAEDQVIFAGEVADDELVDHYCLGDVFVMPNRELPNGDTEGFGLVFLEANSCGLPVIAGRDGGSTDAVQDGQNGLIVDGNSVADIKHAMARLRSDASLRAQLRERGRTIADAANWKEKTALFMQLSTA